MTSRLEQLIVVPSREFIQQQQQWIKLAIKEIGDDQLFTLVNVAADIKSHAYNPYSHYAVGAALLTEKGNIYASPNTEVVSYSETGHAEGNAIAKAISEGEAQDKRTFIKALAVVHEGAATSGPCGRCRQCIAEHADNALIVVATPKAEVTMVTSLGILFPYAFTPRDLGVI